MIRPRWLCRAAVASTVLAVAMALTPWPGIASDETRAEAVDAPADEQLTLRVFEIRYRDVTEVSLLVHPLLGPDAVLEMNSRTRTVTVRDRPDVVRQVADFIRQFDVPPHAAVVRIVVEKAERSEETGPEGFREFSSWTFSQLADTTIEVLERGHARQVFGPDDSLEIHVRLESVDPERRLMHFEEFSLARREPGEEGAESRVRELLSTTLELEDRVGKVVMTASHEEAREALVVRVIGLVRERGTAVR